MLNSIMERPRPMGMMPIATMCLLMVASIKAILLFSAKA
jgi:hypothetical protein